MCMRYPDYMLLTGQEAPAFQAKAIRGMITYPEDFTGKWVVLFSIPRDFVPESMLESKLFADLLSDFETMNTKLIGLCADSIYHYLHCSRILKQMEEYKREIFIERISIVEDAEQAVAKKYCMIQTDYRFLKQTESFYIIDPFRRIRCIQNYTDSTWKELKEIKYIVAALQKADAEG